MVRSTQMRPVAPQSAPAPELAAGLAPPRRAAAHTAAGAAATALPLRRWLAGLAMLDLVTAAAAGGIGLLIRFGDSPGTAVHGSGVPYALLAVLLPPVWVGVLAVAGAYDQRFLATGTEEFRRVVNGAVWLIGGTAFAAFAVHADLSRGFVALTIPLAGVLTVAERWLARRALHRQIMAGHAIYRTLVVGSASEVADLVRHVSRVPWAGFAVVGVATLDTGPGSGGAAAADPAGCGPDVERLVDAVHAAGADTIAVAGLGLLGGGALRRLSWRLEGSGIRLVVVPAVTDVAGPRIVVRPVQGLPLLHVEEPELSGGRRLVKAGLDRAGAGVALVALSPVLLAVALAVALSGGGPVLFAQERVGLGGRRFRCWKFRTMRRGADRELPLVAHLNTHDGLLFKAPRDPRVTAVGRRLRRLSLDELPQLWNVLTGSMSLVGPRPPLPEEVVRYGDDVRRRLLVKPGMTGLWQVSGRADLPWEEAVRLDLYYVENWSVSLDLVVLWKTVFAVLRGRGAY